ncbi:hypothetical protein ACFL27_16415, partial [candidate division CSSED10-310 bacterium]
VQVLRTQKAFFQSLHFMFLLLAVALVIIGLLAPVINLAGKIFLVLSGIYVLSITSVAVSGAHRFKHLAAALGVLVLMPVHHFTILCGIVCGMFYPISFRVPDTS